MPVRRAVKLKGEQLTNMDRDKSVLVVDDSRLMRSQVEGLLQGFGYMTSSVANGREGLDYLRENKDVDLVVLDVVMPVLDGRTTIEEIRSDSRTMDLPILILTSTEHVDLVAQCLEAGGNDYLVKPVDPRLLYQRVQGLIEEHPRSHHRVQCNVVAEVSTGPEQFVGEIQELCEAGAGLLLKVPLMEKGEYRTPRELVLLRFSKGLEKSVKEGLYNCSLCGSCELACPLKIPLPEYLQNIRNEVVREKLTPEKHVIIDENVKSVGNPYGRGD